MTTEDWLFEKSLEKLVALDGLNGLELESPRPPPVIGRGRQRNYKRPERRFWSRNSFKLRWMLKSKFMESKWGLLNSFKTKRHQSDDGIQDICSWNNARWALVTSFSAGGTVIDSWLSYAQLSEVGTSSWRFSFPGDPGLRLGLHRQLRVSALSSALCLLYKICISRQISSCGSTSSSSSFSLTHLCLEIFRN